MRSAGARPFHLGLGHASAGFCLQASANIDDLALILGNIRHGWILRLSARPAGRDEGQQECCKDCGSESESIGHDQDYSPDRVVCRKTHLARF